MAVCRLDDDADVAAWTTAAAADALPEVVVDDACWMAEWALKAAKKLAKNGRFVDMPDMGLQTRVRKGWVVGESFSRPRSSLTPCTFTRLAAGDRSLVPVRK